jgi:hypothetical protein
MNRMAASLSIGIAACVFMAAESYSCSCRPVSLEDQFAAATIVFVATIMESKLEAPAHDGTSNGGGQHVKVVGKVRVEDNLKGNASSVQTLETRLYLPDIGVRETIVSSCDVGAFVPGELWIVFATSDGAHEVSGCSATRRVRDVRELNKLKSLSGSMRPAAYRGVPHATCEDARA